MGRRRYPCSEGVPTTGVPLWRLRNVVAVNILCRAAQRYSVVGSNKNTHLALVKTFGIQTEAALLHPDSCEAGLFCSAKTRHLTQSSDQIPQLSLLFCRLPIPPCLKSRVIYSEPQAVVV